MPTVRQFSRILNLSATTVTSAFALLERQKIIRAEVGRGTFVEERPQDALSPLPDAGLTSFRARLRAPQPAVAWRRRALMTLISRLRASSPDAIECSTGGPDPALLPYPIVRRAWNRSTRGLTARDLQYAGPEPITPLREQLKRHLVDEGIPVRDQDLLICNSAQQAFTLAMEILGNQSRQERVIVAVEEPGYPTMLDTLERSGFQMAGLTMDEFGVLPVSLESALRAKAHAVFLTPRGQNPTGASWSDEWRSALADVLAAYPHVLVLEDDHLAEVASTQPGSLLADPRLESRVLYVRSFSKSIAPDLRIAVVAARPKLLEMLSEAKSFADGWTSRLVQRVLTEILADSALESALETARRAYGERRHRASEAINRLLVSAGGGAWAGTDGVNFWVHLPAGRDAHEVIERSSAAGVLFADGEPFYLSPGHRNVLRMNAGSVPPETAAHAGTVLAEAALATASSGGPIYV